MQPRRFVVVVLAIAVVFATVVLWPRPGEAPITDVHGPVPEGARLLPAIELDEGFIERVLTWENVAGDSPSYNDYQKFSESYWDGGLVFEGTFWVPVTWPEYLNLTGMTVELDATREYFLVPYKVYMGLHDGVLWVWAVLHGIFRQPYDAPEWAGENGAGLYYFSFLIQQEQYAVRWYLYTQRSPEHYESQVFMYYNASNPDAYTIPLASPRAGLTAVTVDMQQVRSHGMIVAGISRISECGGSDYNPPGLDWHRVLGNAAILSQDTIFVMGLPYDLLPHTKQDILFRAMFMFSTWPPIGVQTRYFPLDYDPTLGFSPTAWNYTGAYIPLSAPLV